MSSGFVSGGTIENPNERDDEWRKAQQELEEKRLAKEDAGKQEGGKSLYEVLQANKAAKQDAFEEATRLKNQFRALDDEEAEFLDSVLEATRKQEAAVKKETLEQLDVFRRHQEEAERKALEEQNTDGQKEDDAQWVASGRKRKRGHDTSLLKGVKLRKVSSAEAEKPEAHNLLEEKKKAESSTGHKEKETNDIPSDTASVRSKATGTAKPTAASSSPKSLAPVSLALGYTSSDEDD